MKIFVAVFIVMALSLLAGCASGPTTEEITNADYGSPITQDDAQKQILAYFERRLKDPGAAQYKWGKVSKGWTGNVPVAGIKMSFGYVLPVSVNGKNSYGAYIGYKPYKFLFHDEKMISSYGVAIRTIP